MNQLVTKLEPSRKSDRYNYYENIYRASYQVRWEHRIRFKYSIREMDNMQVITKLWRVIRSQCHHRILAKRGRIIVILRLRLEELS